MQHMKASSLIFVAVAIFAFPLAGGVVYPEASGTAGVSVRNLTFDKCHKFGAGFVLEGTDVIVCDNGKDSKVSRGASWGVNLNQTDAAPFTVTAESLAVTVRGERSNDYALYIDVQYADGTSLYGQCAQFDRNPSLGWQKGKVTVMPDKPVKSFFCNLLLRNVAGCVKFRAPVVRLHSLGVISMYDTCFVDVSRQRKLEAPGFMVRDVTAGRGFVSVASGGEAEKIALDVKTERIADATIFDVTAKELSGRDRAVTLVYAIPFDEAAPMVWHSDPRTDVVVDAAGDAQLRTTIQQNAGEGLMSRWPFGAVTVGGKGVALGIDCTAPAVFRVTAHPRMRQLFIAFDLGFAKEHPDAHFRFVRFAFPAKHGFRGALATYQALYPELNEVRIKRHGLWMAFHSISKVEGWEDFGFGVKEGDDEPVWDDAHDILTFHYTEPSTWWMVMPKGMGGYTLGDCFIEGDRQAANGNEFAIAWRRSAFRDEYGRVVGKVKDEPWCSGAVWNLCPLPSLPGGEYAYKFSEREWNGRYGGKTFPQGVDGEYIDSAEGYVTSDVNFNREHFAYSKTPLAYSKETKRPALAKSLMFYEYVRAASERCHSIGRYLMCNGVPNRWPWLVPYSDYNGTETGWIDHKTAQWKPMSDEELLFRRAMSGGKPYCFLMNVNFDKFSHEMVEKYMQRTLAYGLLPSFFSPNASGGHYFSRPELYNRDRPLFRKYVPLCRMVSEAGWRPVNTLAVSETPTVFVEQFGDRYLTVFNSGTTPQNAKIRSLAGAKRAKELVADGEWRFIDGVAEAVIPPETVRLLDFAR